MAQIIIVWGMWGPYHCRRFEVLRDYAAREGHQVTGVSLFSGSSGYQWDSANLPDGAVHINLGKDETKFPLRKMRKLFAIPRMLRTEVALLPSYDHWSLALNAASRLYGSRVVMMNDTHAGTARARGIKAAFKQQVVASFHAGFVAGEPQRRYFAALGLPPDKIFTGYDAVDNDFFASRSAEIRSRQLEVRRQYQLPEHYFLSLGRFVEKKNLPALVRAYRKVLDASRDCQTHLVMVGSGEDENKLRALCQELKLPVYNKKAVGRGTESPRLENRNELPGVHFYGFRQIEENPVFYALADAFVLPSLWEEWGLVVNEAMACGLPVVVSQSAGCSEDLLRAHRQGTTDLPTINHARQWPHLAQFIRPNGFVFDSESVESLTHALLTLLSNPALRAVMGQNSRVVVDHFSCQNFAKKALLAAQAALDGKYVRRAKTKPVSTGANVG